MKLRDVYSFSANENQTKGEQYQTSLVHTWKQNDDDDYVYKETKKRKQYKAHTQNHLTPIKWWTRENLYWPIRIDVCCAICGIDSDQDVVSFFLSIHVVHESAR